MVDGLLLYSSAQRRYVVPTADVPSLLGDVASYLSLVAGGDDRFRRGSVVVERDGIVDWLLLPRRGGGPYGFSLEDVLGADVKVFVNKLLVERGLPLRELDFFAPPFAALAVRPGTTAVTTSYGVGWVLDTFGLEALFESYVPRWRGQWKN
ncbi:hypothetical protein JXA12_00315 [Candidatus Woesearchaeota archaeon]|nr:hypothetical protein [Candidatus Woesearchaeota archaeon]